MTTRTSAAATLLATLLSTALAAGCTGGTESKAAEEKQPAREAPAATAAQPNVDARQELGSINRAIPIYDGAQFRSDLTSRDAVMTRNKYGAGARVYTLATDDSFPQVYHYYTTYLAQFRAFPAQDPYPPEQKNWRTLEVQLNQAMQDPFIPGEALDPNGQQITLQVAETEAEPKTVIRYIVTPGPSPTAPAAAVATVGTAEPAAEPAAPVAR
ncbi:MAG: hypothetical protein JO197_18200 [Acidobacteria bacterium]|nr:hypothetical protein [Acidobacteriota bacterium]MBV9479036.1 hypothetical protein [Acidobacteriota bacterium]